MFFSGKFNTFPQKEVWVIISKEFPGGPEVTTVLSVLWARVRPLVRERKSRKLCSVAYINMYIHIHIYIHIYIYTHIYIYISIKKEKKSFK